MNNIVAYKIKYLSKKTLPGSLGFNYAIEFNLKHGNSRQDYCERYERYVSLFYNCRDKFGIEYQKHWSRKQLKRNWYVQSMSNNIVRFCFKTQKKCFMAQLMY